MKLSLPNFIRFGRAICGDLIQAERREWWLANGLGGYAAGTIAGTLTRCYHGLLIAPVKPPLGRLLVLAKADATLVDGEQRWPLFSNRWSGGMIEPSGHVHIESFYLEGRLPVWRYAIGGRHLEARIWMEHGANTTYLAYRLESERDMQLSIKLLANARDHHGGSDPDGFQPLIEGTGKTLRVSLQELFTLSLKAQNGTIEPQENWVYNFELPMERERGLSERDHHLCVGEARLALQPGRWAGVAASLEEEASLDIEAALERARLRERALLSRAKHRVKALREAPAWVDQLVLAADSFLFARPAPDSPTAEAESPLSIIAGYPWFGDWGRDTMIALPGLTLATGQPHKARRILETFARFIDQGMLPNVFPGQGEVPEYNTVDAALWYIEAWRAYIKASDDDTALREVYPVLQDILACYRRGTRYRIRMDCADCLLYAGEPGIQITWMDAKVDDWVVTPRIGKPAEINALWYNAHKIMEDLAARLGEPPGDYGQLASKIRQGFQRFKNPAGGLYDVLDGPDGLEASVRPNQLLAVSLPHSPLDPAGQSAVLKQCEEALYCSFGLRSLAPSDPAYRPYYTGGVFDRDGAYHQGPVWGWLLGHYALARYRVYGDAGAAQKILEPIQDHLKDAGLGTVSEIFDGAPPHIPRGAPSQAWSVACVLEAWWRLEQAKGTSNRNGEAVPVNRSGFESFNDGGEMP